MKQENKRKRNILFKNKKYFGQINKVFSKTLYCLLLINNISSKKHPQEQKNQKRNKIS